MSSSSYNYSSNINGTTNTVGVNNSSSSSIRILSEQLATNGSTIVASSPSRGGAGASELKLYQAFIFSVPIIFTFVLLLLFYFFYLRRRRVNWSSLRMRATVAAAAASTPQISSLCELEGGLSKELREMLPIIIFNQTFYVKDTQCSVCLGDFQAEERLQQIPGCGHTFHVECIDLWLASHTTCPLCRHSLTFTKPAPCSNEQVLSFPVENNDTRPSLAHSGDENNDSESSNGDPQTSLHTSGVRYTDERSVPSVGESDEDNQVIQNGAHTDIAKVGI